MTAILSPLGWLYGKFADARNALYNRGFLHSHSLGVKTISIGNITTGGTGKTPLVALIAAHLAEKGEKVCVLTRGYGRTEPRSRVLVSDSKNVLAGAKVGGDEPVELARKLLGRAIVIADADRVAAAEWARQKFGITAFVLDDAFQHRMAWRDLDIVCIDATNPFGSGLVLPAGRLREPMHNLSRAGVAVITRANLAADIESIRSRTRAVAPEAAVFVCWNRIEKVSLLESFLTEPSSLDQISMAPGGDLGWTGLRAVSEHGASVMAFCGLGNPESFFLQLSEAFNTEPMADFELAVVKAFPDHHFYTQKDIVKLERQARASGLRALITTAKDATKLAGLKVSMPCFVIEIEPVLADHDSFIALIEATVT